MKKYITMYDGPYHLKKRLVDKEVKKYPEYVRPPAPLSIPADLDELSLETITYRGYKRSDAFIWTGSKNEIRTYRTALHVDIDSMALDDGEAILFFVKYIEGLFDKFVEENDLYPFIVHSREYYMEPEEEFDPLHLRLVANFTLYVITNETILF